MEATEFLSFISRCHLRAEPPTPEDQEPPGETDPPKRCSGGKIMETKDLLLEVQWKANAQSHRARRMTCDVDLQQLPWLRAAEPLQPDAGA